MCRAESFFWLMWSHAEVCSLSSYCTKMPIPQVEHPPDTVQPLFQSINTWKCHLGFFTLTAARTVFVAWMSPPTESQPPGCSVQLRMCGNFPPPLQGNQLKPRRHGFNQLRGFSPPYAALHDLSQWLLSYFVSETQRGRLVFRNTSSVSPWWLSLRGQQVLQLLPLPRAVHSIPLVLSEKRDRRTFVGQAGFDLSASSRTLCTLGSRVSLPFEDGISPWTSEIFHERII